MMVAVWNSLKLSSLVLIAVLTATPAFAQAMDIDQVRKNARSHVGPFYITPSVQLKELGIDSNVFNSAGDQKADFTFNLAPKADVWVPIARRALFRTTVGTDLVWYAQYKSERSVDPQFSTRAEGYVSRLTVFAENAYLNTRQRPNFEIDLRSRHFENNFLGGFDLRLTPKVSFEAAGRRFDTQYDQDAQVGNTYLQKTLNRTTTGLQATLRDRLTPLTTIAVRYDNLLDRFEFSPSRESRSTRVMPGVELNPRALISGRAYLGYRRFTPLQPEVLPKFSGLVAEIDLSYTLLGATNFGVRYRRDLTYSYEDAQPFFVDNSVGVTARRALGSRFDAIVFVDRHKYEYQETLDTAVAAPIPVPPRIDDTWSYGVGVGYRLGANRRIGFAVSYWSRESTTVAFRDYNGLRIGTNATYGF